MRRVLDRMQVLYRESRAGFECIHVPSIDLSTLTEAQTQKYGTRGHRTMRRKGSKGLFRDQKGKDRAQEEQEARHVNVGSSGSSSFFNTHLGVPPDPSDIGEAGSTPAAGLEPLRPQDESDSHLPGGGGKGKYLPPIPRDFAPGAATHGGKESSSAPAPLSAAEESFNEAFNASLGNGMAVRFEINVVKVPWLPLHGIQFRRVGGDGWQYQMLARRVLTELKL